MRYIIIRGIMERSPRRAVGFLKGIEEDVWFKIYEKVCAGNK